MIQDVKKKNELAEAGKRLQEISEIKFGELSDDEILQLLAERKRFVEMKQKYEQLQKEEDDRLRKEQERLKKEEEDRQRKAEEDERLRREKEEKERLQKEQKEEEKRLALEQERAEIAKKRETLSKKKQSLAKEIEELNQAISPAKADDDLLMLIAQRKKLEKELREVETKLLNEPAEATVEMGKSGERGKMGKEMSEVGEGGEMGEKIEKGEKEEKIKIGKKAEKGEMMETGEAESQPSFRESLKKEFGDEEIGEDFPEGGELHRYLTQLKNNTGSLGTLLQEMPADAKKNQAFMLQVAKIDPAYAMHYAGLELKKNEDFNIRVASMKNPRNSGNALAEMLPEARTSRVVLAAVKQDYRNVKFIQPNMEDYDEIIRIAKKATLEKLQSLKSAADMLLIIPRPLQQDRQFMIEAKNIMSGENKKAV